MKVASLVNIDESSVKVEITTVESPSSNVFTTILGIPKPAEKSEAEKRKRPVLDVKKKQTLFGEIMSEKNTRDKLKGSLQFNFNVETRSKDLIIESLRNNLKEEDGTPLNEGFKNQQCEVQAENIITDRKLEMLENQLDNLILRFEAPPIENLKKNNESLKIDIEDVNNIIIVEEKCYEEINMKLDILMQDKQIIDTRVHKQKKLSVTLDHRMWHAEQMQYTTQISNVQITNIMHDERLKASNEMELVLNVKDEQILKSENFNSEAKELETDCMEMFVKIEENEKKVKRQRYQIDDLNASLIDSIKRLKVLDYIMDNVEVQSNMEIFQKKLDNMNNDQQIKIFSKVTSFSENLDEHDNEEFQKSKKAWGNTFGALTGTIKFGSNSNDKAKSDNTFSQLAQFIKNDDANSKIDITGNIDPQGDALAKRRTENLKALQKNVNIVEKLNEFWKIYPEGPMKLTEKILERYKDINVFNMTMEVRYEELLNQIVPQYNLLNDIVQELNAMKIRCACEGSRENLNPKYFLQGTVSKYSGLIEIKHDLYNGFFHSKAKNKLISKEKDEEISNNLKKDIHPNNYIEDGFKLETQNGLASGYRYGIGNHEEKVQSYVKNALFIEMFLKAFILRVFQWVLQIRYNFKNITDLDHMSTFITLLKNNTVISLTKHGECDEGVYYGYHGEEYEIKKKDSLRVSDNCHNVDHCSNQAGMNKKLTK